MRESSEGFCALGRANFPRVIPRGTRGTHARKNLPADGLREITSSQVRAFETVSGWMARLFPSRVLCGGDIAAMHIPAAQLAALRPGDAFIVSYPRSGNRWIRAMLCDLLPSEAGENRVESRPHMAIADLHQVALDDMARTEGPHAVRIFKSHNIRALTGRKMVYLFRDAADALVSYFHFRLKQPQWRVKTAAVGIDRFCEGMLAGWCDHMQLALDESMHHPGTTRFVSFEMLKTEPEQSLRNVAGFFGLPVDGELLLRAVEKNTFERNVKQLTRAAAQEGSAPILRKGRVGSAAEELQGATIDKVARVSKKYYDRAVALALASRDDA